MPGRRAVELVGGRRRHWTKSNVTKYCNSYRNIVEFEVDAVRSPATTCGSTPERWADPCCTVDPTRREPEVIGGLD
jgi:hypothetical protein